MNCITGASLGVAELPPRRSQLARRPARQLRGLAQVARRHSQKDSAEAETLGHFQLTNQDANE